MYPTMVKNTRYLLLILLSIYSCSAPMEKKVESEPSLGKDFPVTMKDDSRKIILFFGNSITAGFGLDISEAFPALIQQRLDSNGLDYSVVNAGLSGETTAAGNTRVEWILEQKIDIFVLELGANDGLRGIPLTETRANLISIIEKVWKKDPNIKIVLAGMEIPPNMGPEYTAEFRSIFADLAKQYSIHLIPFLLKNVGGIPELNLPDGIHPTSEGHAIIVNNVWPVLEPLL